AGRDEDKRLDASDGGIDALNQRQRERQGLPRAGAGLPNHVVAVQHDGDGLGLDRGRDGDVHGVDGRAGLATQAELGERGQLVRGRNLAEADLGNGWCGRRGSGSRHLCRAGRARPGAEGWAGRLWLGTTGRLTLSSRTVRKLTVGRLTGGITRTIHLGASGVAGALNARAVGTLARRLAGALAGGAGTITRAIRVRALPFAITAGRGLLGPALGTPLSDLGLGAAAV